MKFTSVSATLAVATVALANVQTTTADIPAVCDSGRVPLYKSQGACNVQILSQGASIMCE